MSRARFVVPCALAGALLPVGAMAQVSVDPASGRVSIRATGQPVSSLLDQIAQKTGMKVDYEKAPPRQSVSLVVDQRTPAQAVVAVLEGLNIPYALSLTADGLHVQTLVIADASAPPKGSKSRVGRETSMAPPPEDTPQEAPPDPAATDPTQVEQPQEAIPAPEPAPTRRGAPPPPPITLPSAFPPFGAPAEVAPIRPEAQPEQNTPPQVPQAEKEPNV